MLVLHKLLPVMGLLFAMAFPAQMSAQKCGGFFQPDCPKVVIDVPVPSVEKAFVPEFDEVISIYASGISSHPVNNTYFATLKTAQIVAQKFGASTIREDIAHTNIQGSYVYKNNGKLATHKILVFAPGTPIKNGDGQVEFFSTYPFEINAGWIADAYRRMPEKDFPAFSFIYGRPPVSTYRFSVAEQFAWRMLRNLAESK